LSPPFVLVHGAWHRGACWQPLVAELEARGERVVAVDLPCEDPDAGLADYATAVVEAAAGFDEPVVVVGHSLGGLTIPLIPDRRPVAALVFVAAILPAPGRPAGEGLGAEAFSAGFPELTAAHQSAGEDGASRWDREGAIAAFYHDVPEALLDGAVGALRGQQWKPVSEDWPLTAYPDVPMGYVACSDDRIMDPAWQVRMAKERLGIEPEIIGGSHSPMLARPAELADLLQDLAFSPGQWSSGRPESG
jgi:pimeloyl-ACP methyl ester carboxylesterase